MDRPGVAPATATGRRVPAGTTVDGDLDPADGAGRVSGGAGHGQLTAVGDGRSGARRGDADRRWRVVGGRGSRDQPGHQRRRLRAHIRQQVHGGLLHAGVDGRRRAVVDAVQAPGELDRARAEHERAARGAIERQVVRGRTRRDCGPVVLQVLADSTGGRRQLHQTSRAGTVVEILIGLVPDRVLGQSRGRTRRQAGDGCVAPEAHLAVGGRDRDGEVAVVGHVGGAGQRVLRPATVGRRALTWVTPGTGPYRRVLGVHHVEIGLLVGDHRPVRGAGPVRARLPARLPVDLVAAEERQVHTGIAGRLDVRPLRA